MKSVTKNKKKWYPQVINKIKKKEKRIMRKNIEQKENMEEIVI